MSLKWNKIHHEMKNLNRDTSKNYKTGLVIFLGGIGNPKILTASVIVKMLLKADSNNLERVYFLRILRCYVTIQCNNSSVI
jgi:hypothetical protein